MYVAYLFDVVNFCSINGQSKNAICIDAAPLKDLWDFENQGNINITLQL